MTQKNRAAEAFKKLKEKQQKETSINQTTLRTINVDDEEYELIIQGLRELESKFIKDLSNELHDIHAAKGMGAYIFLINQLILKLS